MAVRNWLISCSELWWSHQNSRRRNLYLGVYLQRCTAFHFIDPATDWGFFGWLGYKEELWALDWWLVYPRLVQDKYTIGSADQHIVLLPTESIIDGSVALFTLLWGQCCTGGQYQSRAPGGLAATNTPHHLLDCSLRLLFWGQGFPDCLNQIISF